MKKTALAIGMSVALGTTLLATPALGAEPAADAPCVRENLAWPTTVPWSRIDLLDAEPTGRFQVAWGALPDGGNRLIRWTDGVPEALGEAPGSVEAISSTGKIIYNTSDDVTYESTAWRLRDDGSGTALPGLAGYAGQVARDIAPDGTVAGWVRTRNGPMRAVTWSPQDELRELPTPDGYESSRAEFIGADGTVVGSAFRPDGSDVTRWLPDGTVEVLPFLGGPGRSSSPVDVAGEYVLAQEDDQVAVWSPDGGRVAVGGPGGAARAVSSRGSVVWFQIFENDLWINQGGTDRPVPFGPSAFPNYRVAGVTDDDVVYGNNFSTPVRWICS